MTQNKQVLILLSSGVIVAAGILLYKQYQKNKIQNSPGHGGVNDNDPMFIDAVNRFIRETHLKTMNSRTGDSDIIYFLKTYKGKQLVERLYMGGKTLQSPRFPIDSYDWSFTETPLREIATYYNIHYADSKGGINIGSVIKSILPVALAII